MRDTMTRSIVKSLVWRALGVAILGGVSFYFTGSAIESLAISITFNGIRVVLYVAHERIWERILWGRTTEAR